MREIFIQYNPYRLETKITVDGNPVKQNSRLNVSDRRLQEWIEELPQILLDELSSRDYRIVFKGALLDYEDLESVVQTARKQGFTIILEHMATKEADDKEKELKELFHQIQAGPFEELKKPDVIHAFKQAMSDEFEVSVVATMSSGKSTLINALLRQKLMPAKQEACTAIITRIKDTDADHFKAKVYDSNNSLLYRIDPLSLKVMEKLNADPVVSTIESEGNIPFVPAKDTSLVLVDTPGPNNSRDPEHKAATYRILSESSKTLVLYVLNATQLAVNDDHALLRHVAESMKVGGKKSRDRFIFIVNKLDDFRQGEDSVELALQKVHDYLADNGIENANVYPASALTALNIRTILAYSDDDDDDDVYEAKGKVRKFNRNPEMHFEKMAPLTPSMQGEIEIILAECKANGDAKGEALIHCGIVPIEMAIKTYVQKYAKAAKIKNVVDTFQGRLESAKSFENVKQDIMNNQDKQRKIQEHIAVIREKLKNGAEANQFKDKINQINMNKEFVQKTNGVLLEAQGAVTELLSSYDRKLTVAEAKEAVERFKQFADDLQAEVKVELEALIEKNIRGNAENLLNEYKNKVSNLVEDGNIGGIDIDPMKLIEGDIPVDLDSMVSSLTQTENKKERKWIENTNKRWWKFWTWFDEDGHWEDVYKTQEYVDGNTLSQRFFAPIEEQIFTNIETVNAYAKEQSTKIKEEFIKKFDQLDQILQEKLQELESCNNDKEDVESRLEESRKKLAWLQHIQSTLNSILDM